MKLTIRKKLYLGFGVIILIVLGGALYFMNTFANFDSATKKNSLLHEELLLTQEFRYHTLEILEKYTDAALTGEREVIDTEVSDAIREATRAITELKKLDAGSTKDYSDFGKSISSLKEAGERMFLAYSISQEEGNKMMADFDMATETIVARAEKIVNDKTEEALLFNTSLMEDIEIASANIIYFILFLLTIALVIAYISSSRIIKPINDLNKIASEYSSGNYEVRTDIRTGDELEKLGNAFNEMGKKIGLQISYLNNIPTPVMAINKNFEIEYINRTGATVIGKEQSSLKGAKCFDQFKTFHCNTDNCALKQAMDNDITVSKETIARPGGKELPIMYTGSPIKDMNGEITGALEFVADTTKIKEAENYLSRCTSVLLEGMKKFSEGDLDVSLVPEKKGDDIAELYQGFNDVVNNFRNIIIKVSEAVDSTVSASTQISSSMEEMATGANEQSSQTSGIASAIEQMAGSIIQSSKNAGSALQSSNEAAIIAREGGDIIEETVEGIRKIADVVKEAADTVYQLGNNSNEIGKIVNVINEIADQTNLLALNAAIEAARAGEYGRGFAVVADEVRKLAERTTKATGEISSMIIKIQNDTSGAVGSINKGTEEMEKGKALAEKSGDSLKKIIAAAGRVENAVEMVASASEEQSAASEQISTSIVNISSITEEAAAGVQQVARATEDLNTLTDNLQNIISAFKYNQAKTVFTVKGYENIDVEKEREKEMEMETV